VWPRVPDGKRHVWISGDAWKQSTRRFEANSASSASQRRLLLPLLTPPPPPPPNAAASSSQRRLLLPTPPPPPPNAASSSSQRLLLLFLTPPPPLLLLLQSLFVLLSWPISCDHKSHPDVSSCVLFSRSPSHRFILDLAVLLAYFATFLFFPCSFP
jgi:hypothetical protein